MTGISVVKGAFSFFFPFFFLLPASHLARRTHAKSRTHLWGVILLALRAALNTRRASGMPFYNFVPFCFYFWAFIDEGTQAPAMQSCPTDPWALMVKHACGEAWPKAQGLPGRREWTMCGCVSFLFSSLLWSFLRSSGATGIAVP